MKWNSSSTPSENPLCECLFFIGIALNITINFNFFSQRKQSNQNKKKSTIFRSPLDNLEEEGEG